MNESGTDLVVVVALGMAMGIGLSAQRGGGPPRPPATPKAAAPIDVTGNLRIDTDAGQQTRLLNFDNAERPRASRATWQGYSAAERQRIPQPGGLGVTLQTAPGRVGSLKVVTTNLRAGYLRRNGVPYSDEAVVTEYFDRLTVYDSEWLVVLTVVDDRRYLDQPFLTSTHFEREADSSKWMPTPCE